MLTLYSTRVFFNLFNRKDSDYLLDSRSGSTTYSPLRMPQLHSIN